MYKDAKNKPTNVRFSYISNKDGDVTVFDRKRGSSVAGMFKVSRGFWYTYSVPVAGRKPLLLNPNNPDKNKSDALKKLKAFIKRKYKA